MADPQTEASASSELWPQMTGQAISDFIGFSPQWLAKLEKMGFVERLPNRLFDSGAVLRGYMRFLEGEDRRSAKTDEGKQLLAARVEKLRIENRKALDSVIAVETVEATFAGILEMLRSEMNTVPAGIADPLMSADISSRFNGAFGRCQARFDDFRDRLGRGAVLQDDHEGEN